MLPQASEAYLWLSPNWTAAVEFGGGHDRARFVRVAERLCREFQAVVTERYPDFPNEGHKEYWWLTVAGRPMLLMHGPPPWGAGLSGGRGDTAVLIRIGQAFGIRQFIGWRWRLYGAWR